jgi:hypothetical protein
VDAVHVHDVDYVHVHARVTLTQRFEEEEKVERRRNNLTGVLRRKGQSEMRESWG